MITFTRKTNSGMTLIQGITNQFYRFCCHLKSCVLLSLFCFIYTLLSFGTTQLSGAPLRLNDELICKFIDGIEVSYLNLKGDGFLGSYSFNPNWYLDDERPADASMSFRHRLLPDMRMHFSVYDSKPLMSSLTEEGIQQYLANLETDYKKEQLVLANVQFEKAPIGSVPFMGYAYWTVSYDLINAESQEYQYSVTDFVTVVEEQGNFRLRFTGLSESLRRQSSAMARYLNLFSMK